MTSRPAEWPALETLRETLQLAVPLWVAELQLLPPGHREHVAEQWRQEASRVVGEKGDALQFTSKLSSRKAGPAATAFNALAKGIAALASYPGGVTLLGVHWCTGECPQGAARERPAPDTSRAVSTVLPAGGEL
jgi:hypothetical protein